MLLFRSAHAKLLDEAKGLVVRVASSFAKPLELALKLAP